MTPHKPEDVFRAEKERSLTVRNSQHARLLAEAKAAFDKLMAEGQAARKSGRPRKHPLPPLKTSSSIRPPVKPAPAPPAPAPPAKVAPPKAEPAALSRPVAKKPAKSAPVKGGGGAKKAAGVKSAKRAAPKSKSKRSTRR